MDRKADGTFVKGHRSFARPKRIKPPVFCALCNGLISHSGNKKFCSHKCYATSLLGKLHSEDTRLKQSRAMKGRKLSQEHLRNLKLSARRGADCAAWRGGVTTENERLRKCSEYKLWRKSVFERDKYTCIFCGQHGGKLHADHIKPFAFFPELRFAIDNGRTLCEECHKKTDTYGGRVFKIVY